MEIAATAVGVLGLVGLYSTCIETLDALSSAARYGIDRELLQTKIEVERVRLMIWGDAVGLAHVQLLVGKEEPTEDELAGIDEALQRMALRDAVAGLLTCFVRTFEDIGNLQKRYGLVPRDPTGATGASSTTAAPDTVARHPAREPLTATFRRTYARFQDRAAAAQRQATPLTKATWAVADEKKFRALISELRAINDSLTSLLPAVRDRSRVRMRDEIMRATDLGQLQTLVEASDDAAGDIVAETASLRIEMLSTRGVSAAGRAPVPRAVHVAPPTPEPPLVVPRTPDPPLVTAPAATPSPPQPTKPAPVSVPYDNTGALVIHKVYKTSDSLMCYAWLSGIEEVPELEVKQPEFHPAFALRSLPGPVIPVADGLLRMDVEADPMYAGWSPGSTSLTGFSRELNFWRKVDALEKTTEPSWTRTSNIVPLSSDLILKRWVAIVKDGLGNSWTEKKGYDSVRELLGPSDYVWLNQDETYKVRHQISDLLAAMNASPVPGLQESISIGVLANIDQATPKLDVGFIDFLLQMLLAREVTLRMAKVQQQQQQQQQQGRWYGGVTVRIVYDLVAAELWSQNMDFITSQDRFEPRKAVQTRQVGGILAFAEEMRWPYLSEIRETARKLLASEASKMALDIRTWDWLGGLVLPGAMFPLAVIGTLYSMSPTLSTRMPGTTVKIHRGNYGIVYPQASYWTARSVLGKVLAPLSQADAETAGGKTKCLGGWVGPCPSPSLPESTFGLLAQLKGRPPSWVAEDTGADGDTPTAAASAAQSQQVNAVEWALPVPPPPSADMIALQTLRLTKVAVTQPADNDDDDGVRGDHAPPMYLARLDFRLARGKLMATMTLQSNSVFVAAMPCRGGPHRIKPGTGADYMFRTLGVEALPRAELDGGATAVTVINATGGPAAETFARAWCSEKGTNAVVWRRGEGCCFKCALMVAGREGVAAGVLIMC
ncbi:hypothetical protein LZ32DRAFT_653516 [Colletotrichum eremochloae]|nr:hypothetical protein LZ32DRAFT_653516 [Colletotrichum eremochloae]